MIDRIFWKQLAMAWSKDCDYNLADPDTIKQKSNVDDDDDLMDFKIDMRG